MFHYFLKKPQLFISMPKRSGVNSTNRKQINKSVINKKQKLEKKLLSNLKLSEESMTSGADIEILNTPVKSNNDKKEYRVIRLKNGLVACLISDPSKGFSEYQAETIISDSEVEVNSSDENDSENESAGEQSNTMEYTEFDKHGKTVADEEKMAAASLSIGVGSFSDPTSIPGLAHFLEHMVFMGSEKYPQENKFDAYLKKRGGSDNATTDCTVTTFYFECLEKYLEKALDIWSQFFISPLMKRDSMTREREAIDSEFQICVPSDTHRREQIITTCGSQNSPVNKFMWGNLKSLRDDVTDDVLYESVHDFRKRHYSAHRMTLAIQARLPLDVLQKFVIDNFSDIPRNDLPPDDFTNFVDNVFNNEKFTRMYYIKPVKDVYQIDLAFPLPPLINLYKSKPHHYVSWLLGHEGKGSLLSYLKNKIWVHSICAGNTDSGIDYNCLYTMFTITIVPTLEGMNHVEEILDAVFSYINLLKRVGPQERIYNEIKTIHDTNFRFKEEDNPGDNVDEISKCMQYYPPEDYISATELFKSYNPEGISMILEKLDPKKVNILILSSILPDNVKFDKVEPWFSIEYTDLEIPTEWIAKWATIEPLSWFSMPVENQFLPTNFDLLELSEPVPLYPEKLIDSDLVELWYKQDNKFKLPYAFINYYIMNTSTLDSASSACMVDLFINMVLFLLSEEAYPANVAQLVYTLRPKEYGIVVEINGYSDKLPLLLELIMTYIRKLPNEITENSFNAVKDLQTKYYYNRILKPTVLARMIRLSLLQDKFWDALEKYNAIKSISYEEFIKFSNNFLNRIHLQALIQGNILKKTALEVNVNVISILKYEPIPRDQITNMRVARIPIGKTCIKVKSINKNDNNSIVSCYFQVGPGDFKTCEIVDLLMVIMEEPLFDILRTKEQLGYDVQCMLNDTFGIIGFSIIVNTQVTKFSTEYIDERIDNFIKYLIKKIKKKPENKFNEIKANLIQVKQIADVLLKDEVSRNWREIVLQTFIFDRQQREIEAIKQIAKSDVRSWLYTYSLDSTVARKLCVQVEGHLTKNNEGNTTNTSSRNEHMELEYVNNPTVEKTSDYQFVSNLESFKSDLFVFPVHKYTS